MCMFVTPMLLYVYLINDSQTVCEHVHVPRQCFMALSQMNYLTPNKTYQLTHIVMAIQRIGYY